MSSAAAFSKDRSGAERYQNADSSGRDRIVLVDQAAEEITPPDLWHALHRIDVALFLGYAQPDAAVRALSVVVSGAGPRPWRRSSRLIELAPTRMPSLRSSPWILT